MDAMKVFSLQLAIGVTCSRKGDTIHAECCTTNHVLHAAIQCMRHASCPWRCQT